MEKSLSECSPRAQAFILAQLTRNQYAIDYWMAALSTLKEMPFFKHDVKRMYNNVLRDVNCYNLQVRKMVHNEQGGDDIDAYEIMLDNTAEFHEALKRQMYYYEQGISRVIQRNNIPHADFLCKLSAAKDLLDIVAFVDGMEIGVERSIENIGRTFGLQRDMPYMTNSEYKTTPTVMGYLTRVCGRMNFEIIKQCGLKEDVRVNLELDQETSRTSEIVTKNLIHTLLDYTTIMTMYEGEGGKTFREAKEISDNRLREAEQRERNEAAKKARREQIKKAKAESKQ